MSQVPTIPECSWIQEQRGHQYFYEAGQVTLLGHAFFLTVPPIFHHHQSMIQIYPNKTQNQVKEIQHLVFMIKKGHR